MKEFRIASAAHFTADALTEASRHDLAGTLFLMGSPSLQPSIVAGRNYGTLATDSPGLSNSGVISVEFDLDGAITDDAYFAIGSNVLEHQGMLSRRDALFFPYFPLRSGGSTAFLAEYHFTL